MSSAASEHRPAAAQVLGCLRTSSSGRQCPRLLQNIVQRPPRPSAASEHYPVAANVLGCFRTSSSGRPGPRLPQNIIQRPPRSPVAAQFLGCPRTSSSGRPGLQWPPSSSAASEHHPAAAQVLVETDAVLAGAADDATKTRHRTLDAQCQTQTSHLASVMLQAYYIYIITMTGP